MPAPLHAIIAGMASVEQNNPCGAAMEGNASPKGAILALEYGRARIGMAMAREDSRLPEPLGTLERVNRNEDMRRLRELAREHQVTRIVVGLPLRLDGTRGEMAEEAARFAERVRKQIGVPVTMVDERLTSWEAERLLEETIGRTSRPEKVNPSRKKPEVTRRKHTDGKRSVDAVAATVILKEFLEQGQHSGEASERLNDAGNR
jgi:putative pre-16S rRNA nuclease